MSQPSTVQILDPALVNLGIEPGQDSSGYLNAQSTAHCQSDLPFSCFHAPSSLTSTPASRRRNSSKLDRSSGEGSFSLQSDCTYCSHCLGGELEGGGGGGGRHQVIVR